MQTKRLLRPQCVPRTPVDKSQHNTLVCKTAKSPNPLRIMPKRRPWRQTWLCSVSLGMCGRTPDSRSWHFIRRAGLPAAVIPQRQTHSYRKDTHQISTSLSNPAPYTLVHTLTTLDTMSWEYGGSEWTQITPCEFHGIPANPHPSNSTGATCSLSAASPDDRISDRLELDPISI